MLKIFSKASASPSVGASAAVCRSVNILLVASIFCFFDDAVEACLKSKCKHCKFGCIEIDRNVELELEAVSYTHLTLPTNREV